MYFATFLYGMFWLHVKVSLALVKYLFLLEAILRKMRTQKSGNIESKSEDVHNAVTA